MSESTEARLAVALDNIRDLQAEMERARERIHKLQSAVRGVEMLSKEVKALQDQLPHLARQSARDAVTEFWQRRHADTLKNWSTYAAVFSAGAAVAALIVSIVLTH